jgi:hypothetical protein
LVTRYLKQLPNIYNKRIAAGGVALKRLLIVIMGITIIFSAYVIGVKQNATCIACNVATMGLPISQLTLAILACAGSFILAASYYVSQKIRRLQYLSLILSGIFAAIAAFLMTLQINHTICWPCLVTESLFYLIFILMCLNAIKDKSTEREDSNG